MADSQQATTRYCTACGATFDGPRALCPECGQTWVENALRDSIPSVAVLLSTMQGWVRSGLIDAPSLGPVRRSYERRLAELRAGRTPPESITPARARAAAMVGSPQAEPVSTEPAFELQVWLAHRQADVLLYLGAFLLVISALIFVSRQGEELAGSWRVGLLAAYTLGFLVAGVLVRRWPRVREAGTVFLAIGALFTPLNFVLIYTEVLKDRDIDASLIWLAGSSYSAVFYGALFSRGFGKLYVIPAAVAAHVAWGSLFFVIDLPGEWFGAWWMAFAAAAAPGLWWRGWRSRAWTAHPLTIAALALGFSQLAAANTDTLQSGPLPVTYALLTIGVTLSGYQRRIAPTLIPSTAGTVATSIATLWALGIEADWYAYPALVAGALAVTSRRAWADWSPELSHGGWLIAIGGALLPVTLLAAYDEGAHGVTAFAAGAAVLASAARAGTQDGVLADDWSKRGPTSTLERALIGWAAFGMLLGAIAFAQRELGVSSPNTGWSYSALAGVTLVSTAVLARRSAEALPVVAPPFATATFVSLQRWDLYAGHDAVLLAIPAVELMLAFTITHRWSLTIAAAGLGVASAAAAWDAAGWETWTLALAYAAAGGLAFSALAPLRDYESVDHPNPAERALSAIITSWGVLLCAPATAAIALASRVEAGSGAGFDAASTAEYRVLVGLAAATGAALAAEGWRLRRWDLQVPALAIAGAALAAAWPVFDFEWWTLSPVYGAAGAVLLVTLMKRRQYAGTDRDAAGITILSWGGLVAAPLVAAIALEIRLEDDASSAVAVVEYRALIAAVLLFAPALAFEGWRLRLRGLLVAASAAAVTGLVMTIAISEPSNIQAYTVPVAIYLVVVGLVTRSSDLVIEPHLQLHELVTVAGAALLVLPQAEQGFEPGGSGWALVLLGEGTLFLTAAFLLGARWLAVSGVLTVSGVAIRALYVNRDVVPYWLMLGVAGLLLLSFGFVLLLQRERWDRVSKRVSEWWVQRALVETSSTGIDRLALLSALTPAVVAALLPLERG